MHYCEVLQSELKARQQKNSQYSLRAFATNLELSAADLSKVLARKKPLSPAKAVIVAEKLFQETEPKENFLRSVLNSQSRTISKSSLDRYLKKRVQLIKNDVVRDLNRWYDYAIPMLTQTAGFQSDVKWISRRLGVTTSQVKDSIQKLLKHNLLKEVDGAISFNTDYVTTSNKKQTNLSLVLYQKAVLEQSIAKLLQIPINDRSHNSMVLSVNIEKIDLAKKKIQSFLREMSELLEVDPKSEVYQLQVSLFPLTQKTEETK